jgi:lipopolysaccharide transport system ATP-binding protein
MGTISVKNIGKAYKTYPNRVSRLLEWMIPFSKPRHTRKWVLQDVCFEVGAGEAVGLIGMNGAGKSTLLKMITGTTQPTTGSVAISGRVAALLELGMGFHPDFTGRQNAIMAGQLLGLQADEIQTLMPEIEAFAEIGTYMDEPVRMYSSGMQMRLAFSVATARRPDVLIVDEALSVGDAYFQHKSFERIRQFRNEGTTLLLVSHDKSAIQSICDRAILLNKGGLEMQGPPETVMDYYNALLADRQNTNIQKKLLDDGKVQVVSGTGEAKVLNVALKNAAGDVIEVVNVGQPVLLEVEVSVEHDIERLVLGYSIKDRLGQVIYGTNTDLKKQPIEQAKGGSTYVYSICFSANLGVGTYSVQTALVSTDTHLVNNYEWKDLALVFNVINIDKAHFVGCAWIDPDSIEIAQR